MFFSTRKMYHIKCISITLIRKCQHASFIGQYRPIACCTVLYKIIAKVLAVRLKGVMGEIIDPTQVGFVP